MSCIEHDFSKVARLEAYSLEESQFTTPIYSLSLSASTYTSTIVTGSGTQVLPVVFSVPFNRDTLKCQDKSSRSVAGIVHQLTLTWDCEPTTTDHFNMLSTLQNSPHEVVITYFGMQKKVIRTDADGYAFDFQDDNGTMKCSMTLTNGQGLTALL